MKQILLSYLFASLAVPSIAQIAPSCTLEAETRFGYQFRSVDGHVQDSESGLRGDYLYLKLDGTVAPGFTFSWKQRINKMHADAAFFDATDWLTLTYQASPHWEISGGKQVVAIGGYEYDRSPIDVYIASEFWNHISCFQFGTSVAYLQGPHKWMLQFSESPFQHPDLRDLYGYSLMWMGQFPHLKTLYSVNLLEYSQRRYISYLCLGHRIEVGKAALELDLMNRASDHQTFFLRDFSLVANLDYLCLPNLNLMAKVTYDVNRTHSTADLCVLPGTELTALSGGLEYFPLIGNQRVRLHGQVAYTFGNNANPQGALFDKGLQVRIGATWRMTLHRDRK